MSLAETEITDPFECWLGGYGHRPHDLMHVFTRVDMHEAFWAGASFGAGSLAVQLGLDQAVPGASSLTPGTGNTPCERNSSNGLLE